MSGYAMDALSKKRLRVEGGELEAPPVLNLKKLSDRNAHCIGEPF